MSKIFIVLGALNGALVVALGAFGTHVLKEQLSPPMLETYQTGVEYHTIHALALVLTGIVARWIPTSTALGTAGGLFLAGIVLFSGSLYGLALTEMRSLGIITLFGGMSFIIGWLLFGWASFRQL